MKKAERSTRCWKKYIQKFTNKQQQLSAVLRDLGFRFNLKLVLYLEKLVINQKIGKAFPKPRKATKRCVSLYDFFVSKNKKIEMEVLKFDKIYSKSDTLERDIELFAKDFHKMMKLYIKEEPKSIFNILEKVVCDLKMTDVLLNYPKELVPYSIELDYKFLNIHDTLKQKYPQRFAQDKLD
jgi:hypothetical protein